MDNATRLTIFNAQVANGRALKGAIRQIRRAVNDGLRKGNDAQASVHTKVFAQTFCSWAEANFSKVLHTPHGFTLTEIAEVKRVWSAQSLADAWIKAVDLGLKKVPAQRSGFVPNARQSILRHIKTYVSDPALLRNKVAHGQWEVALNRHNTAVNADLTAAMVALDIVQIDRWHGGHEMLAAIVESLIESPERTFARDYWPQLAALEGFAQRSALWTLAAKREALRRKVPANGA
ncbi:hypothetical protein JW805_08045 [Roseomonas aeriglobus]|nr:hypothetical protein [Roseomonas aeriglobus]